MAEANLVGHHRGFHSATGGSCQPPSFSILPADSARCDVYEALASWPTPPLMMLFAYDRRLQGIATGVGCKRGVLARGIAFLVWWQTACNWGVGKGVGWR